MHECDRYTYTDGPHAAAVTSVAEGGIRGLSLSATPPKDDDDARLYAVEFREIFAMHDGDSDGWISLKEMTSLLKVIGVTITEDEIVQAASSSVNSSKLSVLSLLCVCSSVALIRSSIASRPVVPVCCSFITARCT